MVGDARLAQRPIHLVVLRVASSLLLPFNPIPHPSRRSERGWVTDTFHTHTFVLAAALTHGGKSTSPVEPRSTPTRRDDGPRCWEGKARENSPSSSTRVLWRSSPPPGRSSPSQTSWLLRAAPRQPSRSVNPTRPAMCHTRSHARTTPHGSCCCLWSPVNGADYTIRAEGPWTWGSDANPGATKPLGMDGLCQCVCSPGLTLRRPDAPRRLEKPAGISSWSWNTRRPCGDPWGARREERRGG